MVVSGKADTFATDDVLLYGLTDQGLLRRCTLSATLPNR